MHLANWRTFYTANNSNSSVSMQTTEYMAKRINNRVGGRLLSRASYVLLFPRSRSHNFRGTNNRIPWNGRRKFLRWKVLDNKRFHFLAGMCARVTKTKRTFANETSDPALDVPLFALVSRSTLICGSTNLPDSYEKYNSAQFSAPFVTCVRDLFTFRRSRVGAFQRPLWRQIRETRRKLLDLRDPDARKSLFIVDTGYN